MIEMFYPIMLYALIALNESEKPSKERLNIVKVVVFSCFMVFTILFMIEKREEVDD
jgi:hypothetical protein